MGRLEPRLAQGADRATLDADVADAQAVVAAAKAEQARAERLVAERAVPARRLEEAQRAAGVAEARLKAAQARLAQRDETLRTGGGVASGNAFTLRAPIAGRIVEVMATLGASYDEGDHLFRIVKTDELELQAFVPAADVPRARSAVAVALEIPGQAEPMPLRMHHLHDSGAIDPETNALTVQFEVENPGGRLLVGQSGHRHRRTRASRCVSSQCRKRRSSWKPAARTSSCRPAASSSRGDSWTWQRATASWSALQRGISRGDRVVIKGAYEIQLASAAKGLPAEGHVH